MKAKDYIKQFHEQEAVVGESKAIRAVLLAMFKEIDTLRALRKTQRDDAFRAIVHEQEDKWKAMCRLDKRLVPAGFRDAFDSNFPSLKGSIWIDRHRKTPGLRGTSIGYRV